MDERVSVLNGEMLNLAGGLPNGERLLDGLDGTTCTLASITAAYNKLVKSKITKDFEERMKTGIDRVTKEMRLLSARFPFVCCPLAFRSLSVRMMLEPKH